MSEAQQIADNLDAEFVAGRISNHTGRKAALELRKLEATNAELLKALQKISAIELQMYGPDWEEINMAKGISDAAIKKHGDNQ